MGLSPGCRVFGSSIGNGLPNSKSRLRESSIKGGRDARARSPGQRFYRLRPTVCIASICQSTARTGRSWSRRISNGQKHPTRCYSNGILGFPGQDCRSLDEKVGPDGSGAVGGRFGDKPGTRPRWWRCEETGCSSGPGKAWRRTNNRCLANDRDQRWHRQGVGAGFLTRWLRRRSDSMEQA
jgi:hypothetical protein